MPTFGEKLRQLRLAHGLTQTELAEKLGYSAHNFIAMLENGKRGPTVELLLKLMPLFNVTSDQLIRDDLDVDAL
ncbi:MAG TPA: helix-turn-helix transcriptional regulator [Roseiflexaceae bacterium]|nr:helix-turn-helix transcriptional regulator [Roseiflexaceae bacterium]